MDRVTITDLSEFERHNIPRYSIPISRRYTKRLTSRPKVLVFKYFIVLDFELFV